ncbi:ribonuclease Z [Flavobacterium sp. SUN052]|uniref:ribonuclease Z n=1 Tax=Flavobacterium sp. SUN052 TaxID=3002441 RepID=UPI00237D9E23|nr:ribonuclease Z [Flavobacterium sp. SUN052]MEC4005580.1 ribonuclease Z [Flavobacterium sp. SUN052]
MKLTILGCYAATPRTLSNPTSQVLEIKNKVFLIDCAEGTQVQLRKSKVKFSKISHIFISHLHGDHFYGLIGLISTFMLLNRENDLHVYGPKGIKEIILLQLRASGSFTGYGLYFHELESKESETIFEDEKVVVKTIPLNHRVYTNGFLFQEKNIERKLNVDAINQYEIDKVYFNKIKYGGDITLDNGTVIPNSALSFPPQVAKSYAFCSDTMYDERIIPIIENVDYLYHESTFLESEAHLSERTMHSTAKQAATIALKANVKNLILGHYSTRYGTIDLFQQEAQTIFQNVHLADDGKEFEME